MDQDVDRFSRWAASYDRSLLQRLLFAPIHRILLRSILGLASDAVSLVDIGCGTGKLLSRAATLFPRSRLTGVDPSEEMLAVAAQSAPDPDRLDLVQGMAELLPFPPRSFDVVMTTMSFHHWEDQGRAIHEVRRVLSPRGYFFLTDLFPRGALLWLFARGNHGRFIQAQRLERMLKNSGFETVRFLPLRRFGGTIRIVIARARDY